LEPKAFHLDRVADQWEDFRTRMKRMTEDKKITDGFKALLKQVSGNAGEYKFRGKKVAVLRPGKLNLTLLESEQPDLVRKYTRQVIEHKFDQDAFAHDHPELYQQYRAQGLHLVSE
jgi:hypothetical protein